MALKSQSKHPEQYSQCTSANTNNLNRKQHKTTLPVNQSPTKTATNQTQIKQNPQSKPTENKQQNKITTQ